MRMAITGIQLNRVERVLFWTALAVAAVLVVVRIGAAVLVTIFHHVR
jgi:hypothetical protein